MSETRIDYLRDTKTGGQVLDGEGRPMLSMVTSATAIDTSGRQLIPLAELTDKEREQLRLMIHEEFQSMKKELFKEFEQHLAQQFRMYGGYGNA